MKGREKKKKKKKDRKNSADKTAQFVSFFNFSLTLTTESFRFPKFAANKNKIENRRNRRAREAESGTKIWEESSQEKRRRNGNKLLN